MRFAAGLLRVVEHRKGQGVGFIANKARPRARTEAMGLAACVWLAALSAIASAQELPFLGRYGLEPGCAGETVRLSQTRLVIADLVCEVAEIDSTETGTFEFSLSECVQDGEPTRGNALFGYAIDGDAVALSFWGPIIPVFRCEG